MKQGLVSVVITTYGRDRTFVLQAIESVQKQTYKNIELIVIDDNGIDTKIQRENKEFLSTIENLHYVPNLKNSGAQFSRNRGILESKGEYIAFLDDDDIWMPEKIEKQVTFLKKHNLDMVFCNGFRFYDNDLNKTKLYQVCFISDKLISYDMELRGDRIGSTSHPLLRKDCFAKCQQDKIMRCGFVFVNFIKFRELIIPFFTIVIMKGNESQRVTKKNCSVISCFGKNIRKITKKILWLERTFFLHCPLLI